MERSLLLFLRFGSQGIRRGSGELQYFRSLLVETCRTHNPRARPLDPPLATKYIKNSLSYDSKEMHQICAAARKSSIAVVLGFSENDHNSLYIAQCTISPSGAVVMKRRKFKPTHMERTVYGDAGGSSLNNVNNIDAVGRVGALSCWEHMQPLLKYHTISLHEEVHVAGWPPLHPHTEDNQGLFSMSADGEFSFSFPSLGSRVDLGGRADLSRLCESLPDLRDGI
jgi:hypothetical protein